MIEPPRCPDREGVAPSNQQIEHALVAVTAGRVIAVALLLATLFVFSNLAQGPLRAWDEAWHARVALHIARENAFFSYTDGGVVNTAAVKPPLYFWMMALAFKLLGPTEFAARLFPALCHVAMVAAVTGFAYRRFHWTVALVSAFLLCTHRLLVYSHGARSGDIDAPLTLFLTLTMLAVWRLAERPQPWILLLAWAGALLTKGPAALQILPAALLWLGLVASWQRSVRAMAYFVLGAIPLGAFMTIREYYQPGTAVALLVGDAFARLRQAYDGAETTPLFYVAHLLKTSWPVLLGVVITAIAVRGRFGWTELCVRPVEGRHLVLFLTLWWLCPLVLFCVIPTRRAWYAAPSLVPACVLAAWTLRAGLARLERSGRPRPGAVVALIVILGMGAPALRRSVWPYRSDQERAAELVQLVHRAQACDDSAPLIAFGLFPPERFYLDRAGVHMVETMYPYQLVQAVAGHERPVCLACRAQEQTPVRRVLEGYLCEVILRLPQIEVVLLRVTTR